MKVKLPSSITVGRWCGGSSAGWSAGQLQHANAKRSQGGRPPPAEAQAPVDIMTTAASNS